MADKFGLPDDRATMTVCETADVLGIGKDAAYAAAHAGEIPVFKTGRLIHVKVAALKKMLETA